jgi:hypothetical protein
VEVTKSTFKERRQVMGRLQDQMKRDLELKNYSPKTRSCYLASVRSFALHFHRSPEELGDQEIREYLHYLIQEKKVSQSAVAYLVTDLDRPSSSALPGDRRGVISGWKAMDLFEGGLLHPGQSAFLVVSREIP